MASGMHWEQAAYDQSGKLLADFSEELKKEAERIARRQKAGGVSVAYVDDAADRLTIRRPSGTLGDILLSVGLALAGAALGVVTVVVTEPVGTHLQLGLVKPASIGIGVAGAVMASIGGTLKLSKKN